MAKIFTMECVFPTPTFVKGERYVVVEYSPGKSIAKLINKNGNTVAVWAARFTDLEIEEIKEDMKLKCIDSKFKNLTVGKEYTVEDDLGNFVLVRNDKKVKAKYSKKYFEEIKKDEPKRVERKKSGWKCVIPTTTLSYGKLYKLTSIPGDPDHVKVKDNEKMEITVLKKRLVKV